MSRYWKALIASLAPLLLVLEEVRQEVERSGDHLTRDDMWRIVIAGLIALGVYAKGNARPAGSARETNINGPAR